MADKKYVPFTHSFDDPWAGDSADDARNVSLTFRFAKPNKTQIQRLQDRAAKNPGQASRTLILDIVHPDDKEALEAAMEEYPGIAMSFSTAIIKGVGIAPELGN